MNKNEFIDEDFINFCNVQSDVAIEGIHKSKKRSQKKKYYGNAKFLLKHRQMELEIQKLLTKS